MTYILTWNKDKWPDSEMQKLMDDFAAGKEVTNRWKCASHKQCNVGDRVFLSRTGQHSPGLIGSGRIISDAYQDEDFEDPSKIAWYVNVRFDYLTPSPSKVVISHLELGQRLSVSTRVFTPRASGTPYKGNHMQLEALWSMLTGNSELIYADEVNGSEYRHVEGAVEQVLVNRYERDPSARRRCIEFHGASCQACGLNMAHVYGPDLGRDYIHVHHIVPLHTIKETYIVDPEKDLITLCPNCHSMIHQKNPPLSVEELKSKIMPRYRALFS